MRHAALGFSLVVFGAWVAPASAQPTYSTASGLNLSINDDAYNGALGSMTCANLVVGSGSVVGGAVVRLDMTHTWVGDLTIKIVSPANTVVTLASRPGVVEVADDGTATGGDSSNLLIGFPLTFVDGGAISAELMGNTIANGAVVCRDDLACEYDPNAGAAVAGKLVTFTGQSRTGTWRLCVGDGGSGDIGTIDRWSLTLNTGVLTITPDSVDFGDQSVGIPSSSSTVTLANTGNIALNVTALTAPTGAFSRTGGSCPVLPIALVPTSSCTLDYAFTPAAVGAANQILTVTSSDVGSGTIELSGNGVAAEADLQISKSDGVTSTGWGSVLTYTIVASNTGPDGAPGSEVDDVFPAGCATHSFTSAASGGASGNTTGPSAGDIDDTLTLPSGSSVTYTATCTVALTATGSISNTATIAAGAGVIDLVPGNDSATDIDTILNVFSDGFEIGNTSKWSSTIPPPLGAAATYPAGDGSVAFFYDLSALPGGELGPVAIATLRDDAGRTLEQLVLRRASADTPLELRFASTERRTEWIGVSATDLRIELRWSIVNGEAGTFDLWIDGRQVLRDAGLRTTALPSEVEVEGASACAP